MRAMSEDVPNHPCEKRSAAAFAYDCMTNKTKFNLLTCYYLAVVGHIPEAGMLAQKSGQHEIFR